jgi:hypothetical protein
MGRGFAALADADGTHAGGGAHVAVGPGQHALWIPTAYGGGPPLQMRAATGRAIIQAGQERIASRLAVGGGALRSLMGVASLRPLHRQATLHSVVE